MNIREVKLYQGFSTYKPTEIFVSDNVIYFTTDNRVYQIGLDNKISVVAGRGYSRNQKEKNQDDNKLATDISLNPKYMFVHSHTKQIYISEGDRIIRVDPDDGKVKILTLYVKNALGIYGHGDTIYFADELYFKVNTIKNNDGSYPNTIIGNGNTASQNYASSHSNDRLYYPQSVVVSPCGTIVYLRTLDGHIYRMGTDNVLKRIYSGSPSSLSISPNGELIVIEKSKNQIIKIGLDGELTCIVSKDFNMKALIVDERLDSPSSVFVSEDNDIYVACNTSILIIENLFYQKKYQRDKLPNNELIVCKQVLKLKSQQFYESIIENTNLLNSINKKHEEIIQNMVDYLIYEKKNIFWISKFNPVEILAFIGIAKTSQLFGLELLLTKHFINQLNTKPVSILEHIDECRKIPCLHSDLLDKLTEFACKEIIVLSKKDASLEDIPLLESYSKYIIRAARNEAFPSLYQQYVVYQKNIPIERLFNDKETSDILISIDSKQLYCHRSILASSSTYFETLFESNFQDSTANQYTVVTDEFQSNLHETVIKFCYGILDDSMIRNNVMEIFKCANFYGADRLCDHCAHCLEFTINDFYEIVQKFSKLNNSTINEKLERFGLENIETIMAKRENWDLMPEPFRGDLLFKYFNPQKDSRLLEDSFQPLDWQVPFF